MAPGRTAQQGGSKLCSGFPAALTLRRGARLPAVGQRCPQATPRDPQQVGVGGKVHPDLLRELQYLRGAATAAAAARAEHTDGRAAHTSTPTTEPPMVNTT